MTRQSGSMLPKGVPEGTPEGKGLYVTVYPKSSHNTDTI